MKKQSLLLSLAFVLLTMISCREPKEFIEGLTITPSPVELHNGKVQISIEGTYPEKYFSRKLTLEVTPVLKSETTGAEVKGTSKTYVGEKVDKNGKTINYKLGGSYNQTAEFAYTPELEDADLWLEIKAYAGKKAYEMPAVKVAEGVNTTPLLVERDNISLSGSLQSAIASDKFQRIIEEKEDAQILYLINQSNVRHSQIKSDALVALTKAIKEAQKIENREIKSMEISSYASPDGKMDLNEKLSNKRSKKSEKFIKRELRRVKADVEVSTKFTAEDWAGFQELVEASNIQDKNVILRVLSMYQDPEQRETEIKNLSVAFKTLANDILPQLRRSKLELTVNVIGKSDEEIAQLAQENDTVLNVEELLYAATLTEESAEKIAIYKKVIANFPNEFRGYNNLGMMLYNAGEMDAAAANFNQAYDLNKENASVNYNKGLLELAAGNDDKAAEYFGKAAGVGELLKSAQGVIAISKAEYKQAVQLLSNITTNNAALAYIMNKDYSAARNVLTNIENKNAHTYYLLAVVSARQNNVSEVVSNLSKAIQANAALKAKATNDVEFISFIENAEFAALVK